MVDRLRDYSITVTTAADGTGTAQATSVAYGRLLMVEWIDGTFDDGVDAVLSITNRPSGVDYTLLTLTDANDDARYYVREQVCDNTGAGLFYDAADSEPVDEQPLVDGILKLSVTSGGNAKTGGVVVFVETYA